MTVLEDVDLDVSLIVNSMWQNKFFEPWAIVSAALGWKLWGNQNKKKILNLKTKIIEYDGF